MAVEDLGQFKPDVGDINGVSVVNLDLLGSSPIPLHSPTVTNGTSPFVTKTIQMMDRVLCHMDNKLYTSIRCRKTISGIGGSGRSIEREVLNTGLGLPGISQ